MSKFIQRNVRQLKQLKRELATDVNKTTNNKLDQIVKFYEQRKIGNVATAENLIKGLTSQNKTRYNNALKKYNSNLSEWEKAKPLGERIRETRNSDTYLINFQLYTTRKPKNSKFRPAFTKNGRTYYIEQTDLRQITAKTTKPFNSEWIKRIVFKRIYRDEPEFEELAKEMDKGGTAMDIRGLADVYNPEFRKIIEFLRTDKEFNNECEAIEQYYAELPWDAIKIQSMEVLSKKKNSFNVLDENLTDATSQISIYHRYISTPMNNTTRSLKHAIINGNHKKGQCWINSLFDFYENTLMSKKKRNPLTREKMIEIIGRKDMLKNGATITEMDKVFKHYNIQARIFDFFNRLIYKNEPETRNSHIQPFYAMVKNGHIYTLKNDIKSIEQRQYNEGDKPIVRASQDYHLNEADEPPEYKMFDHIDELLKMIDTKEPKTIYLVPRNNNLTEKLFELLNIGYEPSIMMGGGMITQIRMKLKKTTFMIKTQNLIKGSIDGSIALDDEATFNRMNTAMFEFNKAMFNPIHKSFYNEIDMEIYHEAKTIVPIGLLYRKDSIPENIFEADITKAFTGACMKFDEVPVFNQFDIWQKYTDNNDFTKMSDYTLYFVEDTYYPLILSKKARNSRLMFNKKYNLCYGYFLKRLDTTNLKVLYYKSPSQVHKVNYKEIINELWNLNISDDKELDKQIKKLIVNINIGLLEKTNSTNQKSILFKNLNEALNFQQKNGGKVHKLSDVEVYDEIGDDYYKCDEQERNSYYVVNVSDTAELKNGFIYIKELLLQHHNFKMATDFRRLSERGVSPLSVKTDAFTFREEDKEIVREVLHVNTGIGQWRIEETRKEVKLPTENWEKKQNEKIKLPIYTNEEIKIKDEYDTKEIIMKIIAGKKVMIRAKYPGSGKSYICEKMEGLGMKVLFVCPTNKLVQKYGENSITINKFFGISMGDEILEKFDYSKYDVIVFDEIYFNGLRMLNTIREFVVNNPKLIVVATGDGKQLKPVNELTNTQDHETYANNCINQIFKYNIYLNECKRLKTQDDKEKLNKIYDDIFINNINTSELILKYFDYTTVINENENNIAYLNDTCKEVSNEIRRLQNRKGDFEKGEIMICRQYLKTAKQKFQVNFKYKILDVRDNVVSLLEEHNKTKMYLPIELLRKHFIYDYCYTCHSVQGSSIDTGITIFDYNHYLVDNNFFWTAITRATDLKKVKFYKYDHDVNSLFNKQCIFHYLERKIKCYKEQDNKGKRKIDHKNYITVDWLLAKLNGYCELCSIDFHIKTCNGNISTNLTAQRKNNNVCHTINNCIAYCKACNCAMSNREKF